MLQTGMAYHGYRSLVELWLPSVLAVMFIGIWIPAGAQVTPRGSIEIEEGGRLWIEGSAKIVDYSCRARQLSGNGKIKNAADPQENVKGHGAVSIRVSIPVGSLECGKKKMNRDLYDALKAEEYPTIHYQLLDAQLGDSTLSESADGRMNIQTLGILEIAGKTDTTRVMVQGHLLNDNRFRVEGSKQINMETFHIEPPSAMFGLIKASRELTVNFDVIVRLNDEAQTKNILE